MTQIFVSAKDAQGNIVVSDHFEFDAIPRVGEFVVVDERGEQRLRVIEVMHLARPRNSGLPVSSVHIFCNPET